MDKTSPHPGHPREQVLLVDYDPRHAEELTELFKAGGVACSSSQACVVGPEDGFRFASVAVGVSGAGEDRVKRCQRLRDDGYAGAVVALCASAAEGEEVLAAGADDFSTLPFDAREVVTRVRASMKRVASNARARYGSVVVDRVRRIALVRGRQIPLTPRECALLASLVEARGGVVSREALYRALSPDNARMSNVVEVHLSRLRDKLGDDAAMIETVRSVGYRLGFAALLRGSSF
jgi:DNA-binding response OmpR family regulator